MSARVPSVAVVTLGCARNEVDSEELAARLSADGWSIVGEGDEPDAVLVNTCGFIESAKKDSIDAVLAASEPTGSRRPAVVAVGCLAERYGVELADALPEADAVLGFDDYSSIGARLRNVLAGGRTTAHVPRDRRALLPIAPVERGADRSGAVPGHGDARAQSRASDGGVVAGDLPPGIAPASGPRVLRRRLTGGPTAPLKIASGCDRRCAFCAIPSFRGSFISRRPDEIVAEASWLARSGVREVVLVSENTTSYGKDLGTVRKLEELLPELSRVDGLDWIRLSYLQPAEMRPSLIDAIATVPGVVPYFDLSFQHASAPVLRRMRRFGSAEDFLDLVSRVRDAAPGAGIRSNVIVGFPGETDTDLDVLEGFLVDARLDAVGVFGYSDEDGTEAAGLDGTIDPGLVAERVERVSSLVEELTAQRAEDRIGDTVRVLVEQVENASCAEGRAEHQGPEVDGSTRLIGSTRLVGSVGIGMIVEAVVVGSDGVDLVAEPIRRSVPEPG